MTSCASFRSTVPRPFPQASILHNGTAFQPGFHDKPPRNAQPDIGCALRLDVVWAPVLRLKVNEADDAMTHSDAVALTPCRALSHFGNNESPEAFCC